MNRQRTEDTLTAAVNDLAEDVVHILFDFDAYYDAVNALVKYEPIHQAQAEAYELYMAMDTYPSDWREVEDSFYREVWNPASHRVVTMLLGRIQQLLG